MGQNQTAEKRKKLEAERKALVEKIQQTQKILAETQVKQQSTLSQLKNITSQIKTREEIIANIQSEITEVDAQIREARATLDTLKQDLERLKAEYARSIQGAYKARNVYDKMMYVFAAENFNQALKRMRYLNQYSDYRIQQAELIWRTQKEIIEALEKLLDIRRQKQMLVGIKQQEKKELEKDKQQESKVLTQLQTREVTLKRQLAENEKSAKKLNKAIEDLIAKEIEEARKREEARRKAEAAKAGPKTETKVSSSKDMYMTPEVQKLSDDFTSNKNNLPWPVDRGYITERFGTHPHPTIKGAMVNNNGVNIATDPGAKVKAVFKGKVRSIFSIPGMGKVVLINHGKYFTAYAKLKVVLVEEGQEVNARDVIGVVLTDEEENETEVHIEIWNIDKKEDPEMWLKRR
jgi:septal ring factor EnvC (AmiA/AmiB activator)